MKKTVLSNEELKKYICGAVYFEEDDGLIPYRFTKEKMVNTKDVKRKIRHSTGTGIKIDFYSDTEELSFNYSVFTGFTASIYNLYFFDIYVDDVLVLHQGEKDVCEDRHGTINVKFKTGFKRITIYLPGSCAVKITDFSISNGSDISAVSYNAKTLFLGDSITHAAYVDFPSSTYVNLISRRLNYATVNQAIGGDYFSKQHLENLPPVDFDTIFIAYGTNDWKLANDNSPERIEEFLDVLNSLYAKADKYVILPIWRGDMNENSDFIYSFEDVRKIIRDVASKYKMNVIDIFDLMPHDPRLFYDEYLHPNEMGFVFYADTVQKQI